jgi:hypothetical protein
MSPNIRTAMSGGIVTFEMKEAHLRLLLCASMMRLFCIHPQSKRCSGITLLIFSSVLQVARGLFLRLRAENARIYRHLRKFAPQKNCSKNSKAPRGRPQGGKAIATATASRALVSRTWSCARKRAREGRSSFASCI